MQSVNSLVFDSSHASLLKLPEQTQFAESGIVSRTLLATPNLRVVLFAIAAGQELTEHTSGRRALVQILSGSCEFKFNGAWSPMRMGDLLHMPAGHLHAVRVGAEPCSFLLTLGSDAGSVVSTTEVASEANA